MNVSVVVNGIDLEDIGCILLNDTMMRWIPEQRINRVSIPGKYGQIYIPPDPFSAISPSKLTLKLHVCADSEDDLISYKDTLSELFDPTQGYRELYFTDDEDKIYFVRYSGTIPIREVVLDANIEIPLLMSDPFLYSEEKTLTGNGTIGNSGDEYSDLIIEIEGPATDPEIHIGSEVLTYDGSIGSDETLIIDGKEQTAMIDEVDVLSSLSGDIPMISTGNTSVSCSSGTVTFKWRERYII